MWILTTIILMLVSGIVGYLFGGHIFKHILTALGIPYFRTTFTSTKNGDGVNVDAQFNSLFIYKMERLYRAKNEKILEPLAEDNEKVAIFLYDVIAPIAEEYLPPENGPMEDPLGEGIPMLGHQGGEDVRQVVDLGKPDAGSNVDFVS